MSDHPEFHDEIAAFAAGRLEGEAQRRFEAHLAECPGCSDLVATWKSIASGIRDDAEGLLGPHPAPAVLRRRARGAPGTDDPSLTRHLASCPSCELELSVWRAREAGAGAPARDSHRSAAAGPAARRWVAGGALAAGLLIGFALATALRPIAPRSIAPEPVAPIASGALSGPVRLLVLAGPLRGPAEIPRLPVSGMSQPSILIAARPTVPDQAAAGDLYRFEIVDAGSRTVWQEDVGAGQIKSMLEATEVVTLAVPSSRLSAGRYELRVHAVADPAGPVLLRAPFEIIP